MRCTDCSREVLPIGVVDIDGTLSEYHWSLANFAWNYWNIPPKLISWDGLGNFEDYIEITQEQYREAKLAYRQGGYKRVAPLQKDALGFMQYMRSLPMELWIATTRPWSKLDNVDPDTRFWLDRHGIQFDHLLFHDTKYEQLATIVDPDRVAFVVDDLPDKLEEAAAYLPNAYRFQVQRPHNRYGTGGRPGDLMEIAYWAEGALAEWGMTHEHS